VTGNEDGVKHCAMNTLYSLQHLGYSIPPQIAADCRRFSRSSAARAEIEEAATADAGEG